MARRALVLLCLVLGVAASGHGAPQVALGGRAFALEAGAGPELWVPVSFLKNLGITATVLADRPRVLLHAGGARAWLPLSALRLNSRGEPQLPVSLLEDRLGLRSVTLGGRVYLFPRVARLRSALQTQRGVRFVLSGFVPVELEREGTTMRLTFYNALSSLAARQWRWTRGPVRQVTLSVDERPHQTRATLTLDEPYDYTLARRQSGSSFQFDVLFAPLQRAAAQDRWLGRGVSYEEALFPTAAGPVHLRLVRVERVQERFDLRVLLPAGGLGTLESLKAMAQRSEAQVAINANFFDPASRQPIGLVVRQGALEQEDYAQRGVVGVDAAGQWRFLRGGVEGFAQGGSALLPLDGVNRPPRQGELVWISGAYGLPLRFAQPATVARVRNGRITALSRTRFLSTHPGDAFLVATGPARQALQALRVGQPLELRYRLWPPSPEPLQNAVGAGPLLISAGRIALDTQGEAFSAAFASARAARSALGITSQGTLILLLALQGKDSPGLTLEELAHLLLDQGAVQALALDGGSSASLAFRQGGRWRSVGSSRGIAVGLALVPKG